MRILALVFLAAGVTVSCNSKSPIVGACHTEKDCANGGSCDNNLDGGTFRCIPKDSGGGTGGTGGSGGRDGSTTDTRPCTPSSCSGATPICAAVSKMCEPCSSGSQCAGRDGGIGAACNVDAGTCVECVGGSDCQTTKPVCDTSTNGCVQCLISKTHCSGITPICEAKNCRACKTDTDCVTALGADPGVCMVDGHCATPAEVVYGVQPTTTSCSAADGTASFPYCTAQAAVDKARVGPASIVVLRGTFGNISASATAGQLFVVGQNSANINPGGNLYGIDVSGTASIYVRNLAITGGTSSSGAAVHISGSASKATLLSVQISGNSGVGVLAEGGALVVMDRCVVTGMGFGAPADLKTTTSAFKITNCVFTASSSGAILDSAVPTGGMEIFKNNTLVGNAYGLSCSGAFASGLILFDNTNDTSPGCTTGTCCSGMDPLLTADFHLMSTSPCINVLILDTDVPDDIDGQLRPNGAKSDCGADEYYIP